MCVADTAIPLVNGKRQQLTDVLKDSLSLSSWTVCKPASREHMFSGQQLDQAFRLTQIDSASNKIMFTERKKLAG